MMTKIVRAGFTLALAMALTACGTSGSNTGSAGSRWLANPVVQGGSEHQNATPKKSGMAEVYFYRTGQGTKLPVNVYVNNAYLASLLPGGFGRSHLCSGEMHISAAKDDAANRHLTRMALGLPVALEVGEVRYFAVHEDREGRYTLHPSNADEAAAAGVKLQRHTIPRLPLECHSGARPSAASPSGTPAQSPATAARAG